MNKSYATTNIRRTLIIAPSVVCTQFSVVGYRKQYW